MSESEQSPCLDIPLEYLSDMKIICEGRTFKVHKYKLCEASDVLEREIRNPRFVESKGVIKHDEFDAETVERMIQFIYHGDYRVPDIEEKRNVGTEAGRTQQTPENDRVGEELIAKAAADLKRNESIRQSLMAHISVHGIASYYNHLHLHASSSTRFGELVLRVGLPQPGFVDILVAIYKQTKSGNEGLREAVVEAAVSRAKELLSDAVFIVALEDGTTGLGEFAAELAQALNISWQLQKTLCVSLDDTWRASEQRVEQLEQGLEQANKSRDEGQESLRQVGRLIASLRSCRHCQAVDNRLELIGDGRYMIRCRKCKTKHL